MGVSTLHARYDAEAEAQLVRRIDRWPLYPWLPVKRRAEEDEGFPPLGMVFAGDVQPKDGSAADEVRVFDVTTFTLRNYAGKSLSDVPVRETFESVQAMVAAGWVGD